MTEQNATLDRTAFWLLAASLGVVQLKLLPAQVLFGIAAILWVVLASREGWRQPLPGFAVPLGVYVAVTLVSAAASLDPRASLVDCRQLVLFLMVPMVARFARGDRAWQVLDVVMAVGAGGALVGILQFAVFGLGENERPTGLLSHYMTYSGVLMLVMCAAVARVLFYPKQIIWPAIGLPALVVALVFTLTRNAWLGALAGVTLLAGLRHIRLLAVVPVLAAVFLLLAPPAVKARAASIIDPNDPSNRDRLQMLAMGADMIRDHPLLGVGPEMVQRVYGQYLRPDPVHPSNPHLHNVPAQIAAERGIPALLVFGWFVIVTMRDLWRRVRQGPAPALAAAGLAATVAMLVAGLFEYNFGDSEFLMLYLGLITLPFAAARRVDVA